MNAKTYHGSCLCGAVQFETELLEDKVSICHCGQCRKTAGHAWAATYTTTTALRFVQDRGLTWFTSSDIAKRGFCNTCGATLFYLANGGDRLCVAAGAWDDADHLKTYRHIFVADKPDYYDIACTAPQFDKY